MLHDQPKIQLFQPMTPKLLELVQHITKDFHPINNLIAVIQYFLQLIIIHLYTFKQNFKKYNLS